MHRHLARREDRGIDRAAARVDANPVVDIEPGRLRQLDIRHHTDAHHDEIGRHVAMIGLDDRAAAGRATDRARQCRHLEDHAARIVQPMRIRTDYFRQRTLQQARRRIDHRHVAAELARRRRDLEPDEPAAEHRHAATRHKLRAQRPRIVDRADVMRRDAFVDRAAERAHPRACREHEPRIRERRAVVEPHTLRIALDRVDARTEPQLDALRVVPRRVTHERALLTTVAQQRILRQRGPVVRHLALRADHHDARRGVALAQRFGRAPRGMPGADDHERISRH